MYPSAIDISSLLWFGGCFCPPLVTSACYVLPRFHSFGEVPEVSFRLSPLACSRLASC